MEIRIETSSGPVTIVPEQHITRSRQLIWIGAASEAVYNTIIIDGVDIFQCAIVPGDAPGTWFLKNGQIRTLCSRGLKSDRSKACTMCRGCCGYIHTASPDYSQRIPTVTTLLNGVSVSAEGTALADGDIITFGKY